MGRLIEGVWDCQYCGSTKIRGSIRECPVCGRQRDGDVRFYIADKNNYVDDETAKTISKNPDWLCSYCDALNSDNADSCHICGAAKSDSEQNYFEHKEEVEQRRDKNKRQDRTMCNEIKKSQHSTDLSNRPSIKNNNHKKFNWKTLGTIGAAVLVTILLISCLVWVFTPKIQDVTVDSFSWTRTINVEEYRTVEENGWSLPSGARLQYSQQEIQSYQQVLDHYETKTRTYTEQVLDHYETYVSGYRDLGNGYFEEIESQRPVYRTETKTETYQEPVYRSEPIYATKYYYEIDKWMYDYSATSSGDNKEPYWEDVVLDSKHRESNRVETYYISVINEDGEEKKYSFDYDVWNSLSVGDKVTIKTTVFGTAELVTDDEVVSTRGH